VNEALLLILFQTRQEIRKKERKKERKRKGERESEREKIKAVNLVTIKG